MLYEYIPGSKYHSLHSLYTWYVKYQVSIDLIELIWKT